MADIEIKPMTELEAINYMLLSVGEHPVNSLNESRSANVHIARRVLHQTSRQVQSIGLHCNTEENYNIPRNSDYEIQVPKNVIRIDPSDPTLDLVQRDGKLYDKDEHTFRFEETIACDIVWFLPFEDLPEVARDYITLKASRIYQSKVVGSSEQYQFSMQDEMEAYNRLVIEEIDTGDYNMLDNPSIKHARRRW